MLGEEFFKRFPISVFHGPHAQDGTVIARMSNPIVAKGIFGVSERCLFEFVKQGEQHQLIFPSDNRNSAEIEVAKLALREVQVEKQRLGMALSAPMLGETPTFTVIRGGLDLEPNF